MMRNRKMKEFVENEGKREGQTAGDFRSLGHVNWSQHKLARICEGQRGRPDSLSLLTFKGEA